MKPHERPKMSAEQIKSLRETMGWSQAELAKRLGVSQVSVSLWETGVNSPSRPVQMLFSKLREEIAALGRKI